MHQDTSLKNSSTGFDIQKEFLNKDNLKVLQSCRTELEGEDVISQKDIFEESFQDLDFLSHVESIESQNSLDFVDTVADSPEEKLKGQCKQGKDNELLPSKSVKCDDDKNSGSKKSFAEKQICDNVKSVKTVSSIKINCESQCLETEQQPLDNMCHGKIRQSNKISKVSDTLDSETPGKPQNGEVSMLASSGSLKDHLKRKLLQNMGLKSPISPGQAIVEGRRSRLKEAEKEAAILQGQMSCDDIGPFYGLPSKVQQLLQQQRGVSSLYGNYHWKLIVWYSL